MEPYPHHYSHRPKSDDPVDPNFRLMLDEMQRMKARLFERIDGRWSGLEQRVINIEQLSEERLISLEMSRTEAAAERVDMEKPLGDLKLEVGRINRFLERESMANPHTKPSIISTTESASAPPPSSTIADGPNGHRVAHHHQDHEYGSINTHPHIPVNGTNQTTSRVPEHSHELGRSVPHATHVDSMRASHGRLPKLQFPMFRGEDPQLWRSWCENYFDMYDVEQSLWVRVTAMHVEGFTARWVQSTERQIRNMGWDRFCDMLHERFCMSASAVTSMMHSSASCFTFTSHVRSPIMWTDFPLW
jgi:hypothetical protein